MHKFFFVFFSFSLFFVSTSFAGDAYRRVMDTKILRCGYAPWPGLIDVDPNTKKLSGVFYDYLNELTKSMEVKVEWVGEVPFGEIPTALSSGRIDAHCSGAWTNPVRGKFVDATTPISYQFVSAFTQAKNKKFDYKAELINSPGTIISVIDGESSASIAATRFPKAKTLSHPAGTEGVQMLLDVISGKADIALTDMGMLQRIEERNPGQVKTVKLKYPLQVFGNPIWIKKGDAELKTTLDLATQQLINDGTIEKILTQHEKTDRMFMRPRVSYQY